MTFVALVSGLVLLSWIAVSLSNIDDHLAAIAKAVAEKK